MSGWGWVILGYGAVGGVLAAYAASLTARMRRVTRRTHELN